MKRNYFEAIIILSNYMDKYGNLNTESIKRIDKAIEIYRSNKKAIFITCGWDYRKDSKISISDSFKKYLIENFSIDKNKILQDRKARDTVSEAIFTKRDIICKFNFRKIAIITSPYHRERASEIFHFVYGKGYDIYFYESDSEIDSQKTNQEKESLINFRNTFNGIKEGNINNIYNRLIKSHPFFNGTIHLFKD